MTITSIDDKSKRIMTDTQYCPECNGKGYVWGERPVVRWLDGGHLQECKMPCESCNETGEVEIEW